MDKENFQIGKIKGLKGSEKLILETLLKSEKTYFLLSNKDIRLATGLSESAVSKAVRFLKERGILTGNKGSVKILKPMVKKLQEED